MGDERRIHPRAPGVLEGSWSGSQRRCRITSLSVSGCFVESPTPAPAGETVGVEIDLPDQGTVTVEGRVVASDQLAMGFSVHFINLTSDVHEKLTRAVDALFGRADTSQHLA